MEREGGGRGPRAEGEGRRERAERGADYLAGDGEVVEAGTRVVQGRVQGAGAGLLLRAAAWSSSGRAGLLLRAGARRRGRGLAGSRRCGGERARGHGGFDLGGKRDLGFGNERVRCENG